jgi:hypothetical protein
MLLEFAAGADLFDKIGMSYTVWVISFLAHGSNEVEVAPLGQTEVISV